jgi:hypothetical protein
VVQVVVVQIAHHQLVLLVTVEDFLLLRVSQVVTVELPPIMVQAAAVVVLRLVQTHQEMLVVTEVQENLRQ